MNSDLEQALAECGETVTIAGRTLPALVPDFALETGNSLFGEDVTIDTIDITLLPQAAACLGQRALLKSAITIRGETFIAVSSTRHQDGAITLTCRRRATRG